MAFRVDRSELKPIRRLDDGRVIVDARLTRTGVFIYHRADGSEFREWRPPEEVFAQESMDSFAFAPVTDDHPRDMVTAKNAKKLAVGTVGESVKQDGEYVAAPLTVFDAATVAKMDAGKVELSCGYFADVIVESGVTPQGEKYDAIQRNIRGNHVALVDRGRAGPNVRVRMDSTSAVMDSLSPQFILDDPESQQKMDELKEKLAEAYAQLAQLQAKADAAQKELDNSQKVAAEAQAKADSLQAELDAEKKARKDDAEAAKAEVKARIALELEAEQVLKGDSVTDLSDREIREKVAQKLGVEIGEGKTDAYVAAAYDIAMAKFKKAPAKKEPKADAIDASKNDAYDARAKMIQENLNAVNGAE